MPLPAWQRTAKQPLKETAYSSQVIVYISGDFYPVSTSFFGLIEIVVCQ